ncbi:tyrosine-tRNA ligase [Kwoniella pini CBS 10737]|uniref:Tyrosine--tRNA ligase n=1 Tax=Kwoniella pini CBS 10737 TaxID=1296096 RepID=A0A1B9HUN0_9TREE|nr:tyrosine-tRNA ligase [Kwoniella pini CBS 10737]OCF46977.1 tyrosine-tRNA ligase [Kwoniella pini CBS 10737]
MILATNVFLTRQPIPRRICRLLRRRNFGSETKSIIQELDERGFIAALTSPKLHQHVSKPTTIYAGVDPSASSLHVGNLLPLLGLLHFQAKGHQSICLIGGATGSIGDPSGRSTERKSLTSEELKINIEGIKSQIDRFFKNGSEYLEKRGITIIDNEKGKGKEKEKEDIGVKIVDNFEWTKNVTLLDFLRGPGKLSRVSTMLSRDSVKNRLSSDSGISFTEFTYQLLQAFDFSHLWKNYGCKIQLGGSDQWGNIIAGIDLIKRTHSSSLEGISEKGESIHEIEEKNEIVAYGITIPLLTTSTGEKFGKSAGNAIWLDENKTSPAEFYQFFLRTTDEDVSKYLKLFTFLSIEKIEKIMKEHELLKSERIPQNILASEITELIHGKEGLENALKIKEILFPSTSNSKQENIIKSKEILKLFKNDKRFFKLNFNEISKISISKLCVKFNLTKSNSESNKFIENGNLFLNNKKILNSKEFIKKEILFDNKIAILKIGNKKHLILYLD